MSLRSLARFGVAAACALLALFTLNAKAEQRAGPAISARPNPAPGGLTTLTWSAGPDATAAVWVSIDGAPEVLVSGEAPAGSVEVNWIAAGSSHVFRLYEGSTRSKLLASVEVTRAAEPAFIRATPNPVPTDATGLNGTTTLEWNTGNGKHGLVYLSPNAGPELLVAGGARGAVDVPYIKLYSTADFILYDESRQVRLAAVEVLPRMPAARRVMILTFGAAVLLLIVGSYTVRDAAAFRRRVSPVLAVVATAAALLPILTAEPKPMPLQPFPDGHEYADAARQIVSGKGYVTYVRENDRYPDDGQPRPPKYPPGFSLALVPFAKFGTYPDDVVGAARWFAAFYVVAAVVAAWSIGGPLAGMLAAGLIGMSPFAQQSVTMLFADAFGAALTVLLVPLLNKPTALRTAVAGTVAGLSVLVRFSLIVNIAAVALATRGQTRRRALLFAAPALAGLLLYQWLTFGSPLKTGYGYWSPERQRFRLSHVIGNTDRGAGATFPDALSGKLMRWVCPCPTGGAQLAFPSIFLYPAVLAGLFWVFSPPLVTLAGCVYLWKHRRAPPAAAAIWVTVLTCALYVGHFYQSERFMAPPATLLTIFAGVALAAWTERRHQISA
jgi:hypothetical protein